MSTTSSLYQSKGISLLHISVAFLVLILAITGGMYGYTLKVESENESIKAEILTHDTSIMNIKKDPRLQIYDVLSLNESAFADFYKKSQVSTFVRHLNSFRDTYQLSIEGFTYQNGQIGTTISAETTADDVQLAYEKVTSFMQAYKNETTALFALQFIDALSGHDLIEFEASFVLQ